MSSSARPRAGRGLRPGRRGQRLARAGAPRRAASRPAMPPSPRGRRSRGSRPAGTSRPPSRTGPRPLPRPARSGPVARASARARAPPSRWSARSAPRPTSSAPRAGRCSTAGRSPTARARRTPSSRDLIATAPVRPGKEARPAGVLRGRAGTLELVAFDIAYPLGRSLVPKYAVTAAPLLGAVPGLRLSPARFWRHRTGGLVPIVSGNEAFDARWLLLAAEDTPQVRRLVAGPRRPGPAARHRRRRRVLDRRRPPRGDPARRPPAAADRAPHPAAHRAGRRPRRRLLNRSLR